MTLQHLKSMFGTRPVRIGLQYIAALVILLSISVCAAHASKLTRTNHTAKGTFTAATWCSLPSPNTSHKGKDGKPIADGPGYVDTANATLEDNSLNYTMNAQCSGPFKNGSLYNWACSPRPKSSDTDILRCFKGGNTTGNISFDPPQIPSETFVPKGDHINGTDQVRFSIAQAGTPGPTVQVPTIFHIHDRAENICPLTGYPKPLVVLVPYIFPGTNQAWTCYNNSYTQYMPFPVKVSFSYETSVSDTRTCDVSISAELWLKFGLSDTVQDTQTVNFEVNETSNRNVPPRTIGWLTKLVRHGHHKAHFDSYSEKGFEKVGTADWSADWTVDPCYIAFTDITKLGPPQPIY